MDTPYTTDDLLRYLEDRDPNDPVTVEWLINSIATLTAHVTVLQDRIKELEKK